MSTFCAICGDEQTVDLAFITLDDRLYAACKACRTEHPRSGRYSFSGGKADPRGLVHTKHTSQKKGAMR